MLMMIRAFTTEPSSDALLSWTAEPLAVDYTVFWSTVSGPPYTNSSNVGNVTSIEEGDLPGYTPGDYFYTVASRDESGMHGPYATEVGKTLACTTTVSATAAAADAAVDAASAGAVVCINSGTIATQWDIQGKNAGGRVIIMPAPGQTVTISSLRVIQSRNLLFRNMRIDDVVIDDFEGTSSRSITFQNIDFKTGGANLVFDAAGNTNMDVLIYDSDIGGYDSTGFEGTIYATVNGSAQLGPSNLRIEQSDFDGLNHCADGIQITGDHTGVIIGPGNRFHDWLQASCGPHVDAIQIVSSSSSVEINGNYWTNNTIHLGFYDGGTDVTVCNGIFDGQNSAGVQVFQIGHIDGMNFCHNTLHDIVNTSIGTKTGQSQNINWLVENNALENGDLSSAGDDPGCDAPCTVRYNVVSADSSLNLIGSTTTNTVNGTPVFVGGADPATWAGYALSTGSPGENAGNDGKDMGVLYRHLDPPTNLRMGN